MLRRAMQAMAVVWIAHKGPVLWAFVELGGLKRSLAPACHHAADGQTPGGVEVVQPPRILLPARPPLGHVVEMGHKIGGRAGASEGPGHLASRHHQRVDEHACPMAHALGGRCAEPHERFALK
jgi:hypothetical protein